MKKDTIYIDIEDDITSIIDKVKQSASKIVALVPPKRSTALNSAVNMKLLNRAAAEAGKRIVLVSGEATLLSLAGGLGMHVANNLHSKPYVPESAVASPDEEVVIDGSELDPSAPVGELAAVQNAASGAGEGKPPAKAAKTAKPKRGLGFKIPSFERFRGRLFLIGAALVLLLVGWWWAFKIAPRAVIAIQAQTSRVETEFEFTADTAAEEDDFEKNVFQAEVGEISRTVTETFEPTGTKDVGEKATGTITIENCDTDDSFTVPSGTTFTANNLDFESLSNVEVPGASFSGGSCDSPGSADVSVRALKPGDEYNLAPATYSVKGYGSFVTGSGGQMAGGTSREVKVVSRADVNRMRRQLQEPEGDEVLTELKDKFGEEVVAIDETYKLNISDVKSQPAVGEEATSASVTATAKYTVVGVPRETLKKAVEDFINSKIESGDQRIYDNGLNSLVFTVLDTSGSRTETRLETDGYIGPELDTTQLAQDIAGKRYSEVVSIVKSRPGVIDVRVDFSPFWVFSAPAPDKTTINFDIQDAGTVQSSFDEDG